MHPASQSEVLDGLWKLARGWIPDGQEGPSALVDEATWFGALRRLAHALLPQEDDEQLDDAQLETLRLLHRFPATAPSAWAGELVVIVGCGRSGTTWLERLLMASPETGGVDGVESFLFQQAAPLLALRDRERVVPALREFLDTVLSEALRVHSPGARVFIEKTPLHSFRIPDIRAVYPDACFVHLIRDGRDVARSISQVGFFGIPDPADAAQLWNKVVTEVRRQAPSLPRYREVRYEQLAADPVGVSSDLLAWIGVAPAPQELEDRAGKRVSAHAGVAQGVGSDTWQSLPSAALSGIYAEAGSLLVAEGYASAGQLRTARRKPAYWRRRLL